jgi:hypothetical protein
MKSPLTFYCCLFLRRKGAIEVRQQYTAIPVDHTDQMLSRMHAVQQDR